MTVDMRDLEIALNMNNPNNLIDGCKCDPSVGYTCEACFTFDVLAACKREITTLRARWNAATEAEGTAWANAIIEAAEAGS